jgi:hypothetical protein
MRPEDSKKPSLHQTQAESHSQVGGHFGGLIVSNPNLISKRKCIDLGIVGECALFRKGSSGHIVIIQRNDKSGSRLFGELMKSVSHNHLDDPLIWH